MLVVRARKSEESEMKLECLTPEFPQGARVYSVDGVAPSLLNSASAMRSQAILVSAGGGQREAYTMKIRSGCDGGGKGPLVQEELSATLATHQDQTLFELRNTVLNDQGGGFMEVTHGMTGTLRAQEHGHAPITFDKTEGNEKT